MTSIPYLLVLAKQLAPVVGLVLGVAVGFFVLRARRHVAECAARDAETRERGARRHSSGVVLDERVGIVLREPGVGGDARRRER